MLKDEASLSRAKMKKIDLSNVVNSVVEDFNSNLLNSNKNIAYIEGEFRSSFLFITICIFSLDSSIPFDVDAYKSFIALEAFLILSSSPEILILLPF